MKTTILFILISTLGFAQGPKPKVAKSTTKTVTKPDSAALAVKEIQFDAKANKFLYPVSMPDSVRIVKLEETIKSLQSIRSIREQYIQALKTIQEQDKLFKN